MNVPGNWKMSDAVYPIVQYATGHFSAIRRLWSSAAATLRWRKQII